MGSIRTSRAVMRARATRASVRSARILTPEFNESALRDTHRTSSKETCMFGSGRKHQHLSTIRVKSIVLIATVVAAGKIGAAQDLPSAIPPALRGTPTLRLPVLGSRSSDSPSTIAADKEVERTADMVRR